MLNGRRRSPLSAIEMSMNYRNLAVVWIWVGVMLSVVAGALTLGIRAQSLNQAGLVVELGDGSLVTRCVGFAEDEISGYDLLMRSGLQAVAIQSGGMGVTICEIDGEGCPANNCFCKCSGSTCDYWSYWHLVGGEWSYSVVGVNGHRLGPGDVDGWTWGKGEPPPILALEQICAPPATATSVSTATLAPLATDTPTLSATVPLPTRTPQPAGPAAVSSTATWTPTSIPPTESPAPLPSATPMVTATLQGPALPPGATFTRRAVLPSMTPTPRLATLTVSPQDREGRSNYVLFGVLFTVLLGVILVMVVLRQRERGL